MANYNSFIYLDLQLYSNHLLLAIFIFQLFVKFTKLFVPNLKLHIIEMSSNCNKLLFMYQRKQAKLSQLLNVL